MHGIGGDTDETFFGAHWDIPLYQDSQTMQMDRSIFDMKASVEAISLYILICSLSDLGISPTLVHIRSKWSGNEEGLVQSVEELKRLGVLEPGSTPADDRPLQVRPSNEWHRE